MVRLTAVARVLRNIMFSLVKKHSIGATITPTKGGDMPTIRDCSELYAVAETVKCAHQNGCIPCAYKIAMFDLDSEIRRRIPNQNPEFCPRLQLKSIKIRLNNDEHTLGYKHEMSVLTIGDGDFSFSLALARFGCRVVATSYESADTLRTIFGSICVSEHVTEF